MDFQSVDILLNGTATKYGFWSMKTNQLMKLEIKLIFIKYLSMAYYQLNMNPLGEQTQIATVQFLYGKI